MAGQAERPPRGRVGEVRQADPADAAQDPRNAATQKQIHRDHDAMQAQAERVRASVPPEVRDHTVGEIVADAERRADADRNAADHSAADHSAADRNAAPPVDRNADRGYGRVEDYGRDDRADRRG